MEVKWKTRSGPPHQVGSLGQGYEDQGPGRALLVLPVIKEAVITDALLGASLKDDILKTADLGYNGHVGHGVKCSKDVTTAIQGAIILAKLPTAFLQNGYHGNKVGKPHSIPCKVTGHCGCAHPVCLIPVLRGMT